MIDPSLAIQAAIVAALKSDPVIRDLVGDRVFDEVKGSPKLPYISLGPDDVLPDYDQCGDGAVTYPMVNVWSDAVGKVEAKTILGRMAVILDAPLVVEGHKITIHEIERNQVVRAGTDQLLKNGILVPRYVTVPVA